MTPHLHARTGPEARFRFRELLAGVTALALLAGCDLPTDPPEFDTRWIVPADETRFGVGELLPGDVTLTPDSSAFLVDFDPISFSQALAGLCPACVVADGLTVPKPAFAGAFSSTLSMPPEVVSMEVVGGQVQVQLFNGFNFDPIRPAAGAFGTIELTITDESDGDVVGTVVVDGQDQAFPPGTTLTSVVELEAATVEGDIGATVAITSPTGDPVTVDSSLSIDVTVTPLDVLVGSVEIDVANENVNLDPVDLDVEDVDQELTDRVTSGAFVLDVVNPFMVAAEFQIAISGPTIATIQKSASIGPEAESTVVIDFTLQEIRSFLGEPGVILSGGAVVDPAAGSIVVDPGQELILTASLDLTVLVGG